MRDDLEGVIGGAPPAGTLLEASEAGPYVDPTAAIRVLVVDDHALFRRGLLAVLSQEPGMYVVGEAADGVEAVELAAILQPDVVLMDVRMPGGGGIEACALIKEVVPAANVIMLTMSEDENDLYNAIKAGAMGYLLKEIQVEDVARSIRAVQSGQALISPSLGGKLMTELASLIKRDDDKRPAAPARLTDREMDVLRLVARGMNNRDIARTLFISQNTVKNHVRNILEKLHLHSRMEAVVYAVREKLLEIT